ncbi:phage tail protein [Vibrio alginolyticus]|uniref:phage tail-collar fiber domain-containing protein n=1 Tax=Vibrio alginolyticus TaxID=663 RepID=UPI00216007FC|nr:phage tail protein [Vibrio alginolyticus]MCS0129223.1 phage tail protein [Vibrio alginolyticus]MCS0159870.1 phage tail protein [Vibrio alginolyticus]
MTNTTDKSILTAAGKALLAQLNAEEKPLVIDKMIFANVPNRPEFPQPDDVVPNDDVVHEAAVEQRGRLSVDSVIYSTTLTSQEGPFEFNWTGAYCSEYGVLVTIDHHALTPKTVDEPGVSGNTLVRSVVLEYKDIAEITNITVDASTWQYNATPRMKKMDDDVAQAIIDQNGKDWFIEDGFLVTPQASALNIKAGAGYVSGNRVTLEFDRNVQVPNKPSFIYVDAHREGTPTGEQVTLFDFVITADEKDDYTDVNGVKHFVCKIAQVLGDGSVSDLRSQGNEAKLREEGNIKGWGAVGNGVNDDTDAIQLALNNVKEKVVIPSGRFIVTRPLYRISSEPFLMEGEGTLVFKKSNFIAGRPPLDSEISSTSNIDDYVLNDHVYMLTVDRASSVCIRGVKFEGDTELDLGWVSKYPISPRGGYASGYDGRVHGCKFLNIGSFRADGISVKAFNFNGVLIQHESYYVEGVNVTNSSFEDNVSCGLRVENSRNVHVSGNVFKNCGRKGVGNTGYGVSFGQTIPGRKPCITVHVMDNIFQNSSRKFIDTHDCADILISNNEFKTAARSYLEIISQNADYSGLINNIVIKGNKARGNKRHEYHVAAIENSPRKNALEWNAVFVDDQVSVPDSNYIPDGRSDIHDDHRYYHTRFCVITDTNSNVDINSVTIENNVVTDESIGYVDGTHSGGVVSVYFDIAGVKNEQLNFNDNYIDLSVESPQNVTYQLDVLSTYTSGHCLIKGNTVKNGSNYTSSVWRVGGGVKEVVIENNYVSRKNGRQNYLVLEHTQGIPQRVVDRNNTYHHGLNAISWSGDHYNVDDQYRSDVNEIALSTNGNRIITSDNNQLEQVKSFFGSISDGQGYTDDIRVVKTGKNSKGSYRFYSNGDVEQWGRAQLSQEGKEVLLPISMPSSDWMVLMSREHQQGVSDNHLSFRVIDDEKFEIPNATDGIYCWRALYLG